MHHPMHHDTHQPRPLRSPGALVLLALCLSACGGSDVGPAPNSPLTTPMALIINQDDTTMTTLRLDGTLSPVVGTLSLGPAEPDAIGGVSFSLGEWIFVTHTAGNRVAAVDPIGAPAPIIEGFLTVSPADARVRIGQRPTRIYRDPVDKEVLWTTNDGDPATGVDTLAGCTNGGSVSVLHNSHLGVGGEKPRVTSIVCVSGKGEYRIAFSRPPVTSQELALVSSQTTGLISVLVPVPVTGGGIAWSEFFVKIDLCDSVKEAALGHPACDGSTATPNHSAPTDIYWSQATGKIYGYLSGYGMIVEIDPQTLTKRRSVSLTPAPPDPGATRFQSVGITPNGRALLVIIEDRSNPDHVVTRFASIDVTAPVLAVTDIPFPQLQDVRIEQFQLTPDGRQLYLLASNDGPGLTPAQAVNQRKDVLFVFDPSTIPLVAEMALPAATSHAMDLWITGPAGAGSAKGVVVTNATPGVNGTVSLIDAASRMITGTFPVGRNPKMVTVYYAGLAASDNQAMPRW